MSNPFQHNLPILRVSEFRHGVRSMAAIIDMSMLSKGRSFEQASLPLVDQLELHVNAEEFSTYVENYILSPVLFGQALEEIAQSFHEKYREHNQSKRSPTDPSMLPWDKLSKDLKESNRQQASDIPKKLQSIHYTLAPKTLSKIVLFEFNPQEIDSLAKQEHIRFVRERKEAGWILGPERDPEKKISPYLIPWNKLKKDVKDIDCTAIRDIPKIVDKAGFQIIALPKGKGC